MKPIYAYHITEASNLKPILVDGLIPNIGENSRKVHEHHFLTYFTTFNCIETWIKRFNLDKNRIIILKFLCSNYGQRFDSSNDYFTYDSFLPNDIIVIDGKEKSLIEYYEQNKQKIELNFEKSIIDDIKSLKERLEQIKNTSLNKEDSWSYNETEPNIIKTIDLLKKIRYLTDKNKYKELIESIINESLMKLMNNNLEINEDSEIYKSLNIIFLDSISDNPQIDITELNYVTQIISVNMYCRQLNRYKRTQKKYGYDNTIWDFDALPLEEIQKSLKNDNFINLLHETTILHEKSKDIKK